MVVAPKGIEEGFPAKTPGCKGRASTPHRGQKSLSRDFRQKKSRATLRSE